jgi:superfamily I DNA/RNA helicase
MSATFWVSQDDLNAEQAHAVEGIPEATSFLLRGPAGSGKTNILLLRAKWMAIKKIEFRLIVFTASLRKFLVAGCEQYGIDPAAVVTQMSFFRELLREYSVPIEMSGNFEADRSMLAGKVTSLIEAKNIPQTYCKALLVDEAQDYTDTEMLAFRRLTERLVLAEDSRQSIYRVTHTPGLAETLVNNNVVTLNYHYRSGLRLCKVADAILSDAENFPRMQGESRYDEAQKPSSVSVVPCESFGAQMQAVISNLRNQLDLYPDERLGVLFPKREQANEFQEALSDSELAESGAVCVDTLHGAKGWEFRAVHIAGCEALYKMGAMQKRLIYTGILRGKTSVHLYYTGRLPGYLDSALSVLEPPRPNPKLSDLFGGA